MTLNQRVEYLEQLIEGSGKKVEQLANDVALLGLPHYTLSARVEKLERAANLTEREAQLELRVEVLEKAVVSLSEKIAGLITSQERSWDSR